VQSAAAVLSALTSPMMRAAATPPFSGSVSPSRRRSRSGPAGRITELASDAGLVIIEPISQPRGTPAAPMQALCTGRKDASHRPSRLGRRCVKLMPYL